MGGNIYWSSHMNILLVWILIPPIILSIFQRGTLDQLFVGISSGVILIASMLLSKTKRATLFIMAIVVLNVFQIWRNFSGNERVFFQTPQPDVRYSDQLRVIDEVYKRARDNSFEIQAYTIPYFWQDGWTYLFWWRGREKFGARAPLATGADRMYVIIQKHEAGRTFQENWYRDIVSTWGTRTDQFTIGSYTVEERLLKSVLQ